MNKRVDIAMADGTRRRGTASTEHSASSYGNPVIIINNIPHGPNDIAMIGAKIVVSDQHVVDALTKAGYAAMISGDKAMTVRVPAEIIPRLKERAKGLGISQTEAVGLALVAWLGNDGD